MHVAANTHESEASTASSARKEEVILSSDVLRCTKPIPELLPRILIATSVTKLASCRSVPVRRFVSRHVSQMGLNCGERPPGDEPGRTT